MFKVGCIGVPVDKAKDLIKSRSGSYNYWLFIDADGCSILMVDNDTAYDWITSGEPYMCCCQLNSYEEAFRIYSMIRGTIPWRS